MGRQVREEIPQNMGGIGQKRENEPITPSPGVIYYAVIKGTSILGGDIV